VKVPASHDAPLPSDEELPIPEPCIEVEVASESSLVEETNETTHADGKEEASTPPEEDAKEDKKTSKGMEGVNPEHLPPTPADSTPTSDSPVESPVPPQETPASQPDQHQVSVDA